MGLQARVWGPGGESGGSEVRDSGSGTGVGVEIQDGVWGPGVESGGSEGQDSGSGVGGVEVLKARVGVRTAGPQGLGTC